MKGALTRRLPAGAWRRRGQRQPRGAAGPLAIAAGGGASEQVSGAATIGYIELSQVNTVMLILYIIGR